MEIPPRSRPASLEGKLAHHFHHYTSATEAHAGRDLHRFTMAARDVATGKSRKIAPLALESDGERDLFAMGQGKYNRPSVCHYEAPWSATY